MEAAALAAFLYEREYGTHLRELDRKKEREAAIAEERLASNYRRGLRQIPLAPDYIPPSVSNSE